MSDLDEFFVPTPDDIRDSNLRVRRNGLILRGVANPNVTKDSDHYVYATALANNLAPAYQNTVIKADQQMPDTAEGAQLVRILGFYGIVPPAAQGAAGNVILESATPTLVAFGAQLQDEAGQIYKVTLGGTYDNGDTIPVIGVTTGKSTDHETGDVLQWVVAPAFASQTVTVASPGLIDGTDDAIDDSERALLFSHLQNPAGGGNWSQIAAWSKAASSSVYSAFVYPALNGPASVGVCVLGALTYDAVTGFTREVPASVRSEVENYLNAQIPDHVDVTVTTPTDTGATPCVDVDISLGLSLPDAIAAGGSGGGWTDPNPWPILNNTATRCYVSAVTSSTVFTLTSDDPTTTPSASFLSDGVTQIAWFSPSSYADSTDAVPTPAIITGTVTAHSGATGAIQVTVSTPFTGIAVGDYVFPNSVNAEVYARALLTAMGNLGPGQWTSNPTIIPFAARRPLVTRQTPSDLTGSLLKPITDSGDEVSDAAYLYRSATTPGVPANTTLSPFVFVPRRFGFYDKIT